MRTFFLVAAMCIFIHAQLDTSFNKTGFVVHEDAAGVGHDFGQAVAVDKDNRIVVAGFSSNRNHGLNTDLAVWRYLPSGQIDTSFNSKGFFIHDNTAGGNSDEEGNAIALDSHGRIVVVGRSRNAQRNDDMVVWRLKTDGTLDESFAGRGFAVHHSAAGGNLQDYGYAVTIDSKNRILVTGESYAAGFPPSSQMIVWRYLENGELDASFGNGGWIIQSNDWDWGYGITTVGDKIIVTGKGLNPTGMYVWQYLNDGTPDPSFGEKGFIVHNIIKGTDFGDEARGITIDNAGKIVIAGRNSNFNLERSMALWRFNNDGSLDTSFNEKGFVSHSNAAKGKGSDSGQGVAIDSFGRIAVAGRSDGPNGNLDVVVWRYLANGQLDTSFAEKGYIVHHNTAGGNHHDLAHAITIDKQDRIIVVGWSFNKQGNYGMTIWCHK
ncbi:delta-60 repeat domain-containing protein [Candidatus Uabimicrobium sp. HlEnr_7]|uniref:delta-60 repeat domain-containing protein n=1 Tax=Candidatus Uabimicrobium helgolandensis TaxID=3095367 RepID=UPI00355749D9